MCDNMLRVALLNSVRFCSLVSLNVYVLHGGCSRKFEVVEICRVLERRRQLRDGEGCHLGRREAFRVSDILDTRSAA